MLTQITNGSKMNRRMGKATETLNTFLQISEILCSTVNLNLLLEKMLQILRSCAGVDSASILLLDKDDKYLETKVSTIENKRYGVGVRINVGEKVAGVVAVKGEPVLFHDQINIGSYKNYEQHQRQIVSSVVIPIKNKSGRALGVVCINSYDVHRMFSGDDLSFFVSFSSQFSLALENAKRFEELVESTNLRLRDASLELVNALADMLEAKDRYTGGHCARMLAYAKGISGRLVLSEGEKERILYATLLHDIGKVGISDQILNKSSELNEQEWKELRNHPVCGAQILRKIKSLEPIADIVYYHHEKWNGTGYPDGISGTAIPLGARIISVADAYDAMTSDRSYRKSIGRKRAIEKLKDRSGIQFAPDIVNVFVESITRQA